MVCGCTMTNQLASPLDANLEVGDRVVKLELRSGQTYDVRDLRVGGDSSRFTEQGSNTPVTLATREIASIHIVNHTAGAAEGLILGGVGGLIVSYVAVAATHGRVDNLGWFLVFGGSILGGAGGFTVGAINGHDYILAFPADSLEAKDPANGDSRSDL